MGLIDTVRDVFTIEPASFDEHLHSNEPGNIEKYIHRAAKYHANKRVLALRGKLTWFIAGSTTVLVLLTGSFALSEVFRMHVQNALLPPSDRVISMMEYFRKNPKELEKYRSQIIDGRVIGEHLSANVFEEVNFEQFPALAGKELFEVFGRARKEDLRSAVTETFVDLIEEKYGDFLGAKFDRLRQSNPKDMAEFLLVQGKMPERVSLVILPENPADLSACGDPVVHEELQATVALPRDVWQKWRVNRKYVFLQCPSVARNRIYLEIKAESHDRVVSDIKLIGIVPSETKKEFEARLRRQEDDPYGAAFIRPPVEVRLTESTALQLGLGNSESVTGRFNGAFWVTRVGSWELCEDHDEYVPCNAEM